MLLGFIVGLVAEWLRRGLQILAPRFDSGRGLQQNRRPKDGVTKLINKDVGLLVGRKPPLMLGARSCAGVTVMRTKNGAFALIAGLALAAGPSASRAAIVERIIDADIDAIVGSITFPTFTGSSDVGVLFSFDGYTQADITSISWTVDPSTFGVVALDLNALQGDNLCPNGTMDCSNRTLNLSPSFANEQSKSCSFSDDMGQCSIGIGGTDVSIVPVPEPSTWAMMALGFAGLGFVGYRRGPWPA
jgi:hypothetical protein